MHDVGKGGIALFGVTEKNKMHRKNIYQFEFIRDRWVVLTEYKRFGHSMIQRRTWTPKFAAWKAIVRIGENAAC